MCILRMYTIKVTKMLFWNVCDPTGRRLGHPPLMLLRGRWCWQYPTF